MLAVVMIVRSQLRLLFALTMPCMSLSLMPTLVQGHGALDAQIWPAVWYKENSSCAVYI